MLTMKPGIVKIRNDSGSIYTVEELPSVTIPVDGEIDICDSNLASFYDQFRGACDVVIGKVVGAKLWADIQAGDIVVVEIVPPRLRNLMDP
jgi:hypothetical protein